MPGWRYDASPRDRYVDALLDAIHARDGLAGRYADDLADDLTDELARIVDAAAKAGATSGDLDRAIAREKIDRLCLIATLLLAEDADDLAGRAVRAQARAVVAEGRRERAVGPIRKADIEARAALRLAEKTDALRLDDDPPRLVIGGRVPPIEKLSRMTDAELNLLAKRFGVDQDRARLLSAEVRRASLRLVGADKPDEALVDQVLARAEAAVRRTLRTRAKDLVRRYELARIATTDEMPMRWVAVLAGSTSCPSCEVRHDHVQTFRVWQGEGMPGSPNLICEDECRCVLQPDRWFKAPSAAEVDALDDDLAA